MSLQSIEKSSLCYSVGPYLLSVLYIVATEDEMAGWHHRLDGHEFV